MYTEKIRPTCFNYPFLALIFLWQYNHRGFYVHVLDRTILRIFYLWYQIHKIELLAGTQLEKKIFKNT